jgi:hypothetical protein
MQKNHRPHYTVSLPRPERAKLVVEVKGKLPQSSNAEIAGALRLASALLAPMVNRPRLVAVAVGLLSPSDPGVNSRGVAASSNLHQSSPTDC